MAAGGFEVLCLGIQERFMDILSAVSETAFITLKSHVVEAEGKNPVIEDAMAIECFSHPLVAPLTWPCLATIPC